MTGSLKRRNFTVAIILVAVACTSLLLLFNNQYKTADNRNMSPSDIVADIERNLIALEMKQITMEDFIAKSTAYFHKYYAESYFKGFENAPPGVIYAINTTSPQDIQISKTYPNVEGDRQTVFVKIPSPDSETSLVVKNYTFAKEENSWKILQARQSLVSTKSERSGGYLRKFTTINGAPIEYHNLEMK